MANTTTLINSPHCSSCGSTDRQDIGGGDQGYTDCCNKRVCHGDGQDRFGVPGDNVKACCWGQADRVFAAAGRVVPDDACKLPWGVS